MFVGKNGVIIKIDENTGKEELISKFKTDLSKNVKNIAKQMNEIKDIELNEKENRKMKSKLPQISDKVWLIK